MAIRMVEYDFMVAVEQAEKSGEVYRVKMPESCVLYIRRERMKKDTLDVEIEFPDGQKVMYKAKAIPTLAYTLDDIFEKKLYALLPYYILKYESRKEEIESSEEERQKLFQEYGGIAERLVAVLMKDPESGYVGVILDLMKEILDSLLTGQPETRKGIGEIMGGQVLHLASDDIREEGIAIGFSRGEAKGQQDSINKLAAHYAKEHPELPLDKCVEMATAILR